MLLRRRHSERRHPHRSSVTNTLTKDTWLQRSRHVEEEEEEDDDEEEEIEVLKVKGVRNYAYMYISLFCI
jgi:hypothetical protein